MKPTKEIIELARKLHELGYRQEIERWDKVFVPCKNDFHTVIEIVDVSVESGIKSPWFKLSDGTDRRRVNIIPIPSLSQALDWLREHRGKYCTPDLMSDEKDGWVCHYGDSQGDFTIADTPHEAVLRAMIKVLEKGSNENKNTTI